jgi:hypothetical protein
MLHMPRLELLLFMMVLPMVAAAGATLLRGPGAGHVALGVLFAVLLPAAFLGVSLAFVLRYLVRNAVDQRRAVFVLQPPAGAGAGGDGPGAQAAGRSAALRVLGRDSGGALTQHFLAPGDAAAPFAPASSGQFIVHSQPGCAALPAPSSEQARCGGCGGGSAPQAGPAAPRPGFLRRAWHAWQRCVMRPLFGFDFSGGSAAAAAVIPVGTAAEAGAAAAPAAQGRWVCKSKHDTAFVKRYGSLFEDARGPQVYHIRSVYDAAAADGEARHRHARPAGAGSGACASAQALNPRR